MTFKLLYILEAETGAGLFAYSDTSVDDYTELFWFYGGDKFVISGFRVDLETLLLSVSATWTRVVGFQTTFQTSGWYQVSVLHGLSKGPLASDWLWRRPEKKGSKHEPLSNLCASMRLHDVFLSVQHQCHFLMQRRLCMNVERRQVKENQQHRKHLKRTARWPHPFPVIISCYCCEVQCCESQHIWVLRNKA